MYKIFHITFLLIFLEFCIMYPDHNPFLYFSGLLALVTATPPPYQAKEVKG